MKITIETESYDEAIALLTAIKSKNMTVDAQEENPADEIKELQKEIYDAKINKNTYNDWKDHFQTRRERLAAKVDNYTGEDKESVRKAFSGLTKLMDKKENTLKKYYG